ncbi:hypothetical protein [Mycobacterium sp. Z3061]|nr:hypothetical protein [Mycobacterium sp. Z3061]
MARSDNDTWNLASSVGATATAVAASASFGDASGYLTARYAR